MSRSTPRALSWMALLACLLALPAAGSAAAAPPVAEPAPAIPARPGDLRYGELHFKVPEAAAYRHQLSNGVVVYVAEDHALPLVDVVLAVRVGDFLDSPEKVGLASLAGAMMRRGGTESLSADDFDQKADFLAANIDSYTASMRGGASLNCLSRVLDPSLDLFFDMLRHPRFDEGRLEVAKSNLIESMKQRNDDPGDILDREWDWLLYGEDHFSVRQTTAPDLARISRQDLVDFHRAYWRPQNMILAVSGDVDTKRVLAALERRFAGWQADGPRVPWPPPAPTHLPTPGLYSVEKDVPQGRVVIGHLGAQRHGWDDPDTFPLALMNDILGGGGFTSRITRRVRSDEGLAYRVSSSFQVGQFWPGDFRVQYDSKNPTVALAAKIVVEELEKIRQQPVTAEELATAKSSYVSALPHLFESAEKIAGTFAEDDYLGRPHTYWQGYRRRVEGVTAADVLRVAQKYVQPDRLVVLVVGKWDEIAAGDADHRASMQEIDGGAVVHLPLRDPLTLKPKP